MTLDELNALPEDPRKTALATCCGATAWVNQVAEQFPVDGLDQLLTHADQIWWACSEADWREAFAHHPKIGNLDSLREKYAATRNWASGEQAGVASASTDVLRRLAEGNQRYEEKFGYIFIVCATGKSANEMLTILEDRLPNDPQTEMRIAAEEQRKITHIRLHKLLAA